MMVSGQGLASVVHCSNLLLERSPSTNKTGTRGTRWSTGRSMTPPLSFLERSLWV